MSVLGVLYSWLDSRWRDGGLPTADAKAVEAERRDEGDETSLWENLRSPHATFGTSDGLSSPPPPPYYASSRNHAQRGPSTRAREKRKRRVIARVEEERVLLPPSPLKLKMEERQSKPEEGQNPEIEEGDVLEEQMDWMSARLQGLIDDGRRALAKEIGTESE